MGLPDFRSGVQKMAEIKLEHTGASLAKKAQDIGQAYKKAYAAGNTPAKQQKARYEGSGY